MNRRQSSFVARAVFVIAAAAVVTSCSADSTNDVVARVDDTILTFDQLKTTGDPARPEFANGDEVRAEATAWVQSQLSAKSGVDKMYDTAVADLGVMCVDVIQSKQPTDASLKDLVKQIDAGGWTAAATEYMNASGNPSATPCQPTDGVEPIYLDPLTAAKPGEIIQIADPTYGYGVLRLRPFDEVDQNEFLAVVTKVKPDVLTKLAADIADVNVVINPRVGTYSPSTLTVEPLGSPTVADTPAG